MTLDVTSWFVDQLEARATEPLRLFKIGTSDYSDRVVKFPRFKRSANEIRAVTVDVPLANADQEFNNFYNNTYSMVQTCTLELGFTHPTSGDELVKVFTGYLKNVLYKKEQCILKLKDRLWDFTDRKVGDSDVPVDISSTIPSDIAWTLCTCYGGLSSVASTSNPDIDYASFEAWAATFSADTVQMSAHYEGMKVAEALSRLGKQTSSAVWVEGDGLVTFKKFIEPSSLDYTLTHDEYSEVEINVEGLRVVNKQSVGFDYSVESDYFTKTVVSQESASVNSFGLHEAIMQDDSIWYVDSTAALNQAARQTLLLQSPPKRFNIKSGFVGMHMQIGETLRLVDSFHNITSSSGWRITEMDIGFEGQVQYEMDEASIANGFYLDISNLDGDEVLL